MNNNAILKTLAALILGLSLTSCADYYGTGYHYPRTRTYTEINSYRYNTPPRPYPAPQYPVAPTTEYNSNTTSIRNEYEINKNYYSYPQNNQNSAPPPAEYQQRNNVYITPYPNTGSSDDDHRERQGNRPEVDQDRVRTLGQQEYDKKFQQIEQRQRSLQGQPALNVQQNAAPPTPIERFQARREQRMQQEATHHPAFQPTPQPERSERQRPVPLERHRHKSSGENTPGVFQPNR